jgi:hypothetical protein
MSSVFPRELSNSFEAFLKRRKLRERVLAFLKATRDRNNLNRTVIPTASNLTYAKIAELLAISLEKKWINPSDLIKILDESEIAGRHHVYVFTIPENSKDEVRKGLRNPRGLSDASPEIIDFLKCPEYSSTRILRDVDDETVLKIIARRSYWLNEYERDDPEDQLIHRWMEHERSAIIIKCNIRDGLLLQIRVPPKEKGQLETGKAIYAFLVDALRHHYDTGKDSWFQSVNFFPIGDSFNKIVSDRENFIMKQDTPENSATLSRVSKKGPMTDTSDLRDEPSWSHETGYARRSIWGSWICPDSLLFMHLNRDTIQIDKMTTRYLARLFVPNLCTDLDLDYAIHQIRNHI